MARNIATSLRRRTRPNAMARYDRLPVELRAWLADAALPWSACSALRLWQRALRDTTDITAARQRLQDAEARLLARDAPRIWGPGYPLPTEQRNILCLSAPSPPPR